MDKKGLFGKVQISNQLSASHEGTIFLRKFRFLSRKNEQRSERKPNSYEERGTVCLGSWINRYRNRITNRFLPKKREDAHKDFEENSNTALR